MTKDLDAYRAKRDFTKTPEPGPETGASAGNSFVIQKHDASRLHYDFRIELDGVMKSWAVAKGPSLVPGEKRLAVQTEDHPLEYLEFEGDIPEGNYGAGTMRVWDRGTYDLHKFREDEVMVTFHGERLECRYVLFRTDGKNWMIHRMDPPQDADREPMPSKLEPMLARSGSLPPDDERWRDADSIELLRDVVAGLGGEVVNVDATVVCERPPIGPHRDAIEARLADAEAFADRFADAVRIQAA